MKPTLVLIPAYNEEDSVAAIVGRVRTAGFDCAVVVDGSPDLTARRAREAGAIVIELPVNLGIGGALRCGFRYAVEQGYRSVVQCDADGQHPPEDIPRLIKEADRLRAHLLIASRWVRRLRTARRPPLRDEGAVASRVLARRSEGPRLHVRVPCHLRAVAVRVRPLVSGTVHGVVRGARRGRSRWVPGARGAGRLQSACRRGGIDPNDPGHPPDRARRGRRGARPRAEVQTVHG